MSDTRRHLILVLLLVGGALQAAGTIWALVVATEAGTYPGGGERLSWRVRWQAARRFRLILPAATLLAGLGCEFTAATIWLYS